MMMMNNDDDDDDDDFILHGFVYIFLKIATDVSLKRILEDLQVFPL